MSLATQHVSYHGALDLFHAEVIHAASTLRVGAFGSLRWMTVTAGCGAGRDLGGGEKRG